jgi:hypothetical protein
MHLPKINDLSYVECYNCKNYFYVYELPGGINDPNYCAYCGVEFNETMDITDEREDLWAMLLRWLRREPNHRNHRWA